MAVLNVNWSLVIVMVIELCSGQDAFSKQLLARIEQLEQQGWSLFCLDILSYMNIIRIGCC